MSEVYENFVKYRKLEQENKGRIYAIMSKRVARRLIWLVKRRHPCDNIVYIGKVNSSSGATRYAFYTTSNRKFKAFKFRAMNYRNWGWSGATNFITL